jgi:hypothetical protein
MSSAPFDRLYSRAVPLLLRGEQLREEPPVEGGRWPVSVVLPPDPAAAARLDGITQEVGELAGAGHWRTGALGFAHVTVRALEYHRHHVDESDDAVDRYVRAVRAAARRCSPVRLRLTGLTLAPGSVMACALAADDRADRFRAVLAEELGPDGWMEDQLPARDIWYLNLLHFTGDVRTPDALIAWVSERRDLDLGPVLLDSVSVVRFQLSLAPTPGMRPVVLADIALGAPAQPA